MTFSLFMGAGQRGYRSLLCGRSNCLAEPLSMARMLNGQDIHAPEYYPFPFKCFSETSASSRCEVCVVKQCREEGAADSFVSVEEPFKEQQSVSFSSEVFMFVFSDELLGSVYQGMDSNVQQFSTWALDLVTGVGLSTYCLVLR